jgi:hypothetical protein
VEASGRIELPEAFLRMREARRLDPRDAAFSFAPLQPPVDVARLVGCECRSLSRWHDTLFSLALFRGEVGPADEVADHNNGEHWPSLASITRMA